MVPTSLASKNLILVTLALGLTLSSPAHAAWKRVVDERGIIVDQRAVPGRDMPVFRGVTTISATPLELLAILQDAKRQCEWRPSCASAKVLEHINDHDRYVYSLSDAPWPAADRDVVMRMRFEVKEGGEHVRVTFSGATHHKAPEKSGVVRIKQVDGYYDLKALGNGKTRIVYQVESDPGGSVPTWMVVSKSKEVPFETLRNLRNQVKKTRGAYGAFIARWSQPAP